MKIRVWHVKTLLPVNGYIFRNRASGTLTTVSLLSILVMFFASIAILNVENIPESNIKSPGDALWWSFVTITTVGYGDRYPITSEGRIIAGFLMVIGVGLFGTFTGCVTSWFLSEETKEEKNELIIIREEIAKIRQMLADHTVVRD